MPQKKETFEGALKKLESIIGQLERDDLTLQDALKNFEEGVALMRACEDHLRSAEGRLRELLKGEDGAFVEKTLGITLSSIIDKEDVDE